MLKDNFTKEIMDSIKTKEVKSRNYFMLKNISFISLIVILAGISTFLFASFIEDIKQILDLSQFQHFNLKFLFEFLFEFALLSIFGCLLIYLVYRQTDWFFVRNSSALLTIILLSVVVGGILLVSVFSEETFKPAQDSLKKIPFRGNRNERILQYLDEENLFAGKIIAVKYTPKEILVLAVNPRQTVTFRLKNDKKISNITPGQDVLIKYEGSQDGNKYIVEIKPLPPKNFIEREIILPLNPPTLFLRFGI